MKKISFLLGLGIAIIGGLSIGLISAWHFSSNSNQPTIIQTVSGRFTDPEEMDKIFLIQPNKRKIDGNYIIIFREKDKNLMKIWQSPPSPIWKILLADVDDDGNNELALCPFKTEPRDPKKDNRLHIYGWGENGIYAKWRGTFLSKPFTTLTFGDIDGDGRNELVSIEKGRKHKEKKFLCVYRWNGFGFDLISEATLDTEIEDISCQDFNNDGVEDIVLKTKDKNTLLYNLSGQLLTRKGGL